MTVPSVEPVSRQAPVVDRAEGLPWEPAQALLAECMSWLGPWCSSSEEALFSNPSAERGAAV